MCRSSLAASVLMEDMIWGVACIRMVMCLAVSSARQPAMDFMLELLSWVHAMYDSFHCTGHFLYQQTEVFEYDEPVGAL